jgi:hypothetical protein
MSQGKVVSVYLPFDLEEDVHPFDSLQAIGEIGDAFFPRRAGRKIGKFKELLACMATNGVELACAP